MVWWGLSTGIDSLFVKRTLTIVLLILLVALTGCLDFSGDDIVEVEIGDTLVYAEVSDSSSEKIRGLMYRTHLNETEGMLFVYDSERNLSFWMKNMEIPIDMIWLDSNLSIVHIEDSVPPCKGGDCPTYTAPSKAMYILEVRANFTNRNDVQVGDQIKLNRSF
ncbi:MAG: DUF192 domain-containing protein [Halobacteriota archaeon]|nr:DUF192 domain-containing protein [Halobacteriota archaeon]